MRRVFYRIPELITHQGPRTRDLSEQRRRAWLASIHRADLTWDCKGKRVCSDHFHSGKFSKKMLQCLIGELDNNCRPNLRSSLSLSDPKVALPRPIHVHVVYRV